MVTSLGSFLPTYDLGAVSMSLPQIMVTYKASLALTSWVLLAQLLTATALLLPAGRLGDIVGRKKVYNIGFVIFITGAMLCGLSQSLTQLILFRVLQATGASMLQTNSFAIVTAVFPERDRGKGLGFSSTLVSIGTMSGPAIGGFILGAVGWRGVFFLTVPVGILGTILAYLILQEKKVSTPPDKVVRSFDFRGASLSTLAIGSLLAGLSFGQDRGWATVETRVLLAIATLAIVVFPWVESRRAHPLVDTGLLKNRTFAFNNMARTLMFMALSANVLLMPFYLQVVMGYSPARTGMLIAPQSIVVGAMAPIAGWLTNRINTRFLSAFGLACFGTGFFFLTRLNPNSTYADILWRLLLIGFGHGAFQTPNNTSIMDSVTRDKFGISSGVMALGREIGRSLGTSLASIIVVTSMLAAVGPVSLYGLRTEGAAIVQGPAITALAEGISRAFTVAALLCVPAIILSLLRGKTARDKRQAA